MIVQDPLTATFDGMPNSAVQGGYADIILPPEMIGEELIEYMKEAPLIKSLSTLSKRMKIPCMKYLIFYIEIQSTISSLQTSDFS